MKHYLYGGLTDVGWKRELNEDYINIAELGDDCLFFAVADGAGSKNANMLQPASIAIRESLDFIRRTHTSSPSLLKENASFFLNESLMIANRVISAFKVANEELYSGFGATMTVGLVFDDNTMVFGHIGNCQLMLLRRSKKGDVYTPHILTVEQTKAKEQLDEGIIRDDMYWTHPDRLIITGALGMTTEPEIQTFEMKLRAYDFVVLTSDGIHLGITPEGIAKVVIESDNCDLAVRNLIAAAKQEQVCDNMSSIILFNNGEGA